MGRKAKYYVTERSGMICDICALCVRVFVLCVIYVYGPEGDIYYGPEGKVMWTERSGPEGNVMWIERSGLEGNVTWTERSGPEGVCA